MVSYRPSAPTVIRNGGRPLVITTCSASKRCHIGPKALGLSKGKQTAVQEQWRALLDRAETALPAAQIYRGRAFGLALRTADALGADLGIVSAGLGYVLGTTAIPSYDLTVRERAPGSVRDRISGSFDPRAWWSSVAVGPFSANLLEDVSSRPVVLMCLSRSYAEMLHLELTEMSRRGVMLRIFGLNVASALPECVRDMALPYDERLSAISLAGTRVDFPQRAMLHYAESIFDSAIGELDQERGRISRALSCAGVVRRRTQNRVSDEAIKRRIRVLMRELSPKPSVILGHLRRVEKISCEQRRFSLLFSVVQTEAGRQ